MNINDLEKLKSHTDSLKKFKSQGIPQFDPGDLDFLDHDIRREAEKIVREEQQVELLGQLLQSNRDADKKTDRLLDKTDLMLFFAIIAIGIAFCAAFLA